jgi:quercetin dioxygenase-like cupin family protein
MRTSTFDVVTQAVITPAQERESYWIQTELMELLVTPAQSGGAYDLVRTTVPPGGGPPPHLHRNEDELFYVVSGEFEFLLGNEVIHGGAGTALFLPRNVIHSFLNVGEETGQVIVATTPSGFADFVREVGTEATGAFAAKPPPVNSQSLQRLVDVCERHQIEVKIGCNVIGNARPVPPREELWVTGLHVRLLLNSTDTDGRMSVAEITAHPGDFVPPHLHVREDEMFYVLDGEIEFDTEAGAVTATSGTFLHIPKNTLHGFRNVGDRPGKLLNYHTPGGFEHFFRAVGTACVDVKQGPPKGAIDVEAFVRTANAHGMELPAPAQAAT